MTDESDRRAELAVGLVMFGVLIIIGAILITVFSQLMPDVFLFARAHTETTAADTGINYVEDAWNAAPFIVLALGFIMLIARAATERRLGGPR